VRREVLFSAVQMAVMSNSEKWFDLIALAMSRTGCHVVSQSVSRNGP